MKILLPDTVADLLQTLHRAGFQGYVVGGCVRDSLLGRIPGDWDICTNALPAQLRQIFSAHRLVLTGEKHGTVGVIAGGIVYEITTYRLDEDYKDHRHPEQVRFVPELRRDLSRRDFTVNAMAYAPETGLVDEFDGQTDMQKRLIRCVGDPAQRFAEDALRILRALRFAAQLSFTLDGPTAAAAAAAADSLPAISAERLFTELDKLLAGPAAGRVLAAHGKILAGALPEVLPAIGCSQPGRWHCYDVWQHTAMAVGALPALLPADWPAQTCQAVRWAVLLHDLAKPGCKTMDAAGNAHFYGHNQAGARLAGEILNRLKAPRALRQEAVGLIAVHDGSLPETDPETLRDLAKSGLWFLRELCVVKYADLAAHARTAEVEARCCRVRQFADRMELLAATGCYRLSDLAVTGADAMRLGIRPGPTVGLALNRLLNAVMAGTLPNERAALLLALGNLRQIGNKSDNPKE